MKNDFLFDNVLQGDPRQPYPLKWWQLWRFNYYWGTYTYRYKWVRDLKAKFFN